MPHPLSRRYTYMPSGKARKKLGRTLAAEMGDIIDRFGADHPQLNEQLLKYIEELDTTHPEWSGYWDRGSKRTNESQ